MNPDREKPHSSAADQGWEASQLAGINPCEASRSVVKMGHEVPDNIEARVCGGHEGKGPA